MALYNYLRVGGGVTFDNATLLSPLTIMGAGPGLQPASVLLRTVALYALTHTENVNATALIPVVTPDCLKVAPAYDCLFPFSNGGVSLPAPRNHDEIDKIIADRELGILIPGAPPTAPTAVQYTAFVDTAAAGRAATAIGGAVAGRPELTAIPTADENITAQNIFDIYNDYTVNYNGNFFDEVNAVHYIYKLIVRKNVTMVRNIEQTPNPIKVNISNQGLTTHMPIYRSGKCELTLVDSLKAYAGNNLRAALRPAYIEREGRGLTTLKNILSGGALLAPPTAREEADAIIYRDLYRLECIREPAALITNAMFIDLVERNYTNIHGDTYDFENIRKRMPMAISGAVEATRSLWSFLIRTHNGPALNNFIYYRYDYPAIAGIAVPNELDTLVQLENNVLFDYIMSFADNIQGTTNVILNCLNAASRASQINELIIPPLNPFVLVGGTNTYRRIVGTIFGNIIFEVRFPAAGAALDMATINHVFIQSFPLRLINQLLLDWYQVNINLPRGDIQIELQLRT